MTTYALVHGAWHGAWCWERLAAELHRRGHLAVAVDLPCGDSAAGCARYAEIVTTALADADENVVVVGHSLGGLTIPLVAAARPVQRTANRTSPTGPPAVSGGRTGGPLRKSAPSLSGRPWNASTFSAPTTWS